MSPDFPRSSGALAAGFAAAGLEVFGAGRETLPPVDSPDEPPQPPAIIVPAKMTIRSPPRIICFPYIESHFSWHQRPRFLPGPLKRRSQQRISHRIPAALEPSPACAHPRPPCHPGARQFTAATKNRTHYKILISRFHLGLRSDAVHFAVKCRRGICIQLYHHFFAVLHQRQ